MSRLPLTPDQAELSERIYQSLRQAADADLRGLDSVANRQISRWMAPYLWAPDPGYSSPRPECPPIEEQRRPSLFGNMSNR